MAPAKGGTGSRIVWLDNQPFHIKAYIEELRREGHVVEAVVQVQEAQRLLDARAPDLFVSEMYLTPGTTLDFDRTDGGLRTGVPLYHEWLRPRFPKLPVLFFTTHRRRSAPELFRQFSRLQERVWIYEKMEVLPDQFSRIVARILASMRRRQTT